MIYRLVIIEMILGLTSCSPTKLIYSEDRYRLGDKKEIVYKALYSNNGTKAKVLDYTKGKISRQTDFDCQGNLVREVKYYDSDQKFGYEKINKYSGKYLIESSIMTIEDGIRTDTSKVKFDNTFDKNGKLIQSKTINETDTSIVSHFYNSVGLLERQITRFNTDTIATQAFKYNELGKSILTTLKYFEKNITRVDHFIYTDSLLTTSIQINNDDTVRVQKHRHEAGQKRLTDVTEYLNGKQIKYKIEIEYRYLPAANIRFIQCRGSE